jgi:hypothetical protein
LLLDRPQGPDLLEYTCNVIRKCNNKIDLMCLIGALSAVTLPRCIAVDGGFVLYFIGFHGCFCAAVQVVGKAWFK